MRAPSSEDDLENADFQTADETLTFKTLTIAELYVPDAVSCVP
jgi:hypothetical protein